MIHGTTERRQTPGWQRELSEAITDLKELVDLLGLDPALADANPHAARHFPLLVPRAYASRMRLGDPSDPLLRQVLAASLEDVATPGFSADPVGDVASMVAPGVLHKYSGRVLLTVTGACAVHCRYCFRRHFSYADANPAADGWRPAFDYIAADRSIREVILSGGDPLTLADEKIAILLRRLNDVEHVERVRIHTRLPIVLPSRVTPALCRLLVTGRTSIIVVVHANHANEIDADTVEALQRLRATGATLLNQSVLLAGVNDDENALCQLSERLFAAGVLPYYLHLLDRVQGTAHFEVESARAESLWRGVAARLPGYLVPRLVREVPGTAYKMPFNREFAD